MSQQINLFNPAFRKQRMVISAMTAVYCLAATLLVLLTFQVYFHLQIKGLDAQMRAAQKLAQSKRADVERIRGGGTQQTGSALDAEIARLESELKLTRQRVEDLKGGAIGNQQGFAEYLRAFSRQSLDGLWLTGFTIGKGGEISINGRVMAAELVPNYIQRLNQEQVLQGRSFASLSLSTPKVAPAPVEKSKEQKAPPRYLDFSLTTAEPLAATAGAVRVP